MSNNVNIPAGIRPSIVVVRDSLAVVLQPTVVVGIVYALLLVFISLTRGYSALDYVHLGTVWSAHIPSGTWGYDGQFYYQLARDPLGAYHFMDNAPYRYQRILYPLVVRVLSLGRMLLFPICSCSSTGFQLC